MKWLCCAKQWIKRTQNTWWEIWNLWLSVKSFVVRCIIVILKACLLCPKVSVSSKCPPRSDTLKHSVSVCLQRGLVVGYRSLHTVHLFGGETLAVKSSAWARIPGFDTTGSARKIEPTQATDLGLSGVSFVQRTLRILKGEIKNNSVASKWQDR